MKQLLESLKILLENIDKLRDKVLNVFIIPLWPRKILPNHLTILRVIISVLLFFLLFYYKIENGALIISLFFIGAITDLLDGSVARALKEETKFGTILDPIADRILIIPIAIYSLINSYKLLLFLIILLEIISGLISFYYQGKNIYTAPNIFGKVKMALQSVVFLVILLFWPRSPHIFFINMLWISVVLTVVSTSFKYLEIKKILGLHYEKP